MTTKGANASSTTDYEQRTYDAGSNVTSRRLRDGTSIAFTFDKLNRVTLKDLPGSDPDVTLAYDNRNRLTSASQAGNALSFAWDALGRRLAEAGPLGTVAWAYDLSGNRTTLTHPDGAIFHYDYDSASRLTLIGEPVNAGYDWYVARHFYDDLGRRWQTVRGAGTGGSQTVVYFDPVSRPTVIANSPPGAPAGAPDNFPIELSWNPASQIAGRTMDNDAYAYAGIVNENTSGTANGLNQLTAVGATSLTYDTRGNLSSDGVRTYAYDSENKLTSASGGVTLAYDPLGRLYQVSGPAGTTRFLWDGLDLIAEFNGSNVLQKRYVHGDGIDEPLAAYSCASLGWSCRTYPQQDERGSVISIFNADASVAAINRYDEFGKPQGGTVAGRFGYTGQLWIGEVGAYYYKARFYSPTFGRFLQTDPVGYADSPNLYAYVLNDPINLVDPFGLAEDDIVVTGRILFGGVPAGGRVGGGGQAIYVTAKRLRPKPKLRLNSPPQSPQCPLVMLSFDNALPTVHPRFSPAFAKIVETAMDNLGRQGIFPQVNSGYRTAEEQARMRAGALGSNPAALYSDHELGNAIDINGTRGPTFPSIIVAFKAAGASWGGDYRGRKDPPHFYIRPVRANASNTAACHRENG